MAATRLTDSQKRELVARYCAGEGSSELAVVYGCSMNTVSRAVKAALAPEDYERLKQERARASRSGTPAPSAPPDSKGGGAAERDGGGEVINPSPGVIATTSPAQVVAPSPGVIAPSRRAVGPAEALTATPEAAPPSAEQGLPLNTDDEVSDKAAEGSLAIDDAEDFGDDGAEDDSDDVDGLDEGPEPAAVGVPQQPVSCVPIEQAELPTSVYMLVDKTVELDARPLSEFSELGELPPGEEHLQALQVFVNPRLAKRLCGRSQRVIKIPDTRIFERTARYLVAQGISRVVIENGVYSLPGA
jgi:hypothetical protein